MYYNNYFDENLPSDIESDTEENMELIENEKHYDGYMDQVEKTYNDLMNYVNNKSDNKNLLQKSYDYFLLEPLFNIHEIEFSESFKYKLQYHKKLNEIDNIKISDPIDILEINENKVKDDKWITITSEKSKSYREFKKRNEKRKERNRILKEKLKREEMTKRTKDIMKRYLK